ncbi:MULTISPECIES: RNA polymerase sigma factor [Flavobacteriaceae]|uniref:RNA polymerase sigma factor n=1 Tax=Flavobacteriaceae TaxID=49546 RepID=UPI0014930436|nr:MULTISPECIES: sigma factor [Allomuricauda]MDC6367644.1 sigma factor [Muricauda sp. AC10]
MPKSTDESITSIGELTKKVAVSDQKAYNKLFNVLWDALYPYAASLIRNEIAAKDLIQDIWLDYWQRRNSIDPKHIKAYLSRAVRYKCHNYLRNNKFNNAQLETTNIIISPGLNVVSGEWIPINVLENREDRFYSNTKKIKLIDTVSWWYSLALADFDHDGDIKHLTKMEHTTNGKKYLLFAKNDGPIQLVKYE